MRGMALIPGSGACRSKRGPKFISRGSTRLLFLFHYPSDIIPCRRRNSGSASKTLYSWALLLVDRGNLVAIS
ncbi:hypothetical protein I7I48_08726 [Histoplasma ohiense]|nr:hypothetical protein I7I48_08726 [Histoplasma ohiense (nom. inval.)]